MAIILGIDPGSQFTGFGVIETQGDRIRHVTHGVIAPPLKLEFNERIAIISREFDALISRIKPHTTVVEKIFLGKNPDSAFKLGHARGIVVASAIRADSAVVEYAARSVKKGITGNGASTKDQVQLLLFSALGLKGRVQVDASDALALAYHHARFISYDHGSRRELQL
ncbi:MAG: crossover junction endodeoxyribonuclease RuvC [Bdellovibrionota bacterium]